MKDLTFGEHNVCLDSLYEITDETKAWNKFQSNIVYLSQVYIEQKKKLVEMIETMNNKLGDKTSGKLILNFVSFHEKLYSKNAMSEKGEYAIAGSRP